MSEGEFGESDIQRASGNDTERRVSHRRVDVENFSEEARDRIEVARAALAGEYDADFSLTGRARSEGRTIPGSPDPGDLVFQHEDPDVQRELLTWVAGQLEIPAIEDADAAPKIILKPDQDESMKMEVFAKQYGSAGNPWYIVRFLEKDEGGQFGNPLYIVAPLAMIQEHLQDFRQYRNSVTEQDSNG